MTKALLPELSEFVPYLEQIWETHCLTGTGPLMTNLESQLKSRFNSKHLISVANGTLALQLCIKMMPLTGEVITTPITFAATATSLAWENVTPVFVDVDYDSWLISPKEIERKITNKTTGILGVHAFGNVCDIQEIGRIGKENNLKVLYDAAHCFGVKHDGVAVCTLGDASILSFNATKLFHTVEGGAIVTADEHLAGKVEYARRFGFSDNESFYGLGINAKLSEMHAAMGLSILPNINRVIEHRQKISELYDTLLKDAVVRPLYSSKIQKNYAYYPVTFKDERELKRIFAALNVNDIYPRRYFYPSLNLVNHLNPCPCPVAEYLSQRMACLPLSSYSSEEDTRRICDIVLNNL